MGIYTDLFVTFSKIGGFTLGGGYAMVPVMEKEIVDKKQWLTKEEFMDGSVCHRHGFAYRL